MSNTVAPFIMRNLSCLSRQLMIRICLLTLTDKNIYFERLKLTTNLNQLAIGKTDRMNYHYTPVMTCSLQVPGPFIVSFCTDKESAQPIAAIKVMMAGAVGRRGVKWADFGQIG